MAKLFGKELTNEQFIEAFGNECVKRYEKEKVLPSLPICQAILESGWGSTDSAINHGNYHGMNWYNDSVTAKYSHWTMERAPQERDGQMIYQREEFCEFTNIQDELDCLYAWYNRNKPAYKALHGNTDAVKNFTLIKEAGYATSSAYTSSLTRIYNQYPSIKKFDDMVLQPKVEEVKPVKLAAQVNGTHKVGETLAAKDFTIKVTMSNGTTLTNPAGWGATPLLLSSTSNKIQIVYQNVYTTITVPATPRQKKTYYRVQVGSYSVEANAKKMLANLKSYGFDGFITKINNTYKVQVGAYENIDNAYRLSNTLSRNGFNNFITKAEVEV